MCLNDPFLSSEYTSRLLTLIMKVALLYEDKGYNLVYNL